MPGTPLSALSINFVLTTAVVTIIVLILLFPHLDEEIKAQRIEGACSESHILEAELVLGLALDWITLATLLQSFLRRQGKGTDCSLSFSHEFFFSSVLLLYAEHFTQVPLPRPYALYRLALALSKALGRMSLKVLRKIMIIFLITKMKSNL